MLPLKITFTGLMLGVVAALVMGSAKAHDPETSSCCGEADAYWADEIHVRNGKTYAKITDDRPDEPRHRPHIDVGTEIEIPNNKLKWDKSNPTGHGVVFLSRAGYVFCYVQPGGV